MKHTFSWKCKLLACLALGVSVQVSTADVYAAGNRDRYQEPANIETVPQDPINEEDSPSNPQATEPATNAPATNAPVTQEAAPVQEGFIIGGDQPMSASQYVDQQYVDQSTTPMHDSAPWSENAGCASCSVEEASDPFTLQGLFDDSCGGNWLGDNGWTLTGNTAMSWVGNFDSPNDRFNGPVTFTDRSNDFQVNQVWMSLDKQTDADQCGIDVGGNVTALYGTNFRWATAAGFEDRFNTSHSFYGLALPNMYAEFAARGLKTKVGRFISPVGYFTLDTTQNFFYTLPYTYQYGEPFTHTGFLSTWNMGKKLVAGSGMTRGWDNWDGSGAGSPGVGYIGSLTYTADDKSTLAWVGTYSNEYNNQIQGGEPQFSPRYLQTVVWNVPLDDNWTYVAQSDFGCQSETFDFAGRRDIGSAYWYGLNQYLIYKVCDHLSWGANFEWFRDDGGYRVGSLLPTLTDPTSAVRGLPANRYGYDGSFFRFTFGPRFRPTQSVMFRPNVQYDWFNGESQNPGAAQPFDDGNKSHQWMAGADFVMFF